MRRGQHEACLRNFAAVPVAGNLGQADQNVEVELLFQEGLEVA